MSKPRTLSKRADPIKRQSEAEPAENVGIVAHYINQVIVPSPSLIQRVRAGLAYSELEALRAALGLPMESLAAYVGMSRATMQRRKQSGGALNAIQSDRLVRLARLVGKAIDVMEGKEGAREWLTSPQHGLGGATPLDYADTEVGAREVENLLGRIEHGVFS